MRQTTVATLGRGCARRRLRRLKPCLPSSRCARLRVVPLGGLHGSPLQFPQLGCRLPSGLSSTLTHRLRRLLLRPRQQTSLRLWQYWNACRPQRFACMRPTEQLALRSVAAVTRAALRLAQQAAMARSGATAQGLASSRLQSLARVRILRRPQTGFLSGLTSLRSTARGGSLG
jgi:hypothetical protein